MNVKSTGTLVENDRARQAKYYVASCWEVTTLNDLVTNSERRYALLIFENEYDLPEGLTLMEQKGWRLVEVQQNRAHVLGRPTGLPPDFYYVFEKCKRPKAPKTDQPA